LNWLIAKCLIKLPYIGLVNIVAQKKIVPEFIQFQANPGLIAKCLLENLNNKANLEQTRSRLEEVARSLGTPGASTRAAESILSFLG